MVMQDKDQICSKSNCRSVAIISNPRSKSLQYRDDIHARIRSPELDVTGPIGVPVGEKVGLGIATGSMHWQHSHWGTNSHQA